jgi:hypothetical protein
MTFDSRGRGWLGATGPLWPLGLARIVYGVLDAFLVPRLEAARGHPIARLLRWLV